MLSISSGENNKQDLKNEVQKSENENIVSDAKVQLQYDLACNYYNGKDIKQNYEKAFKFCKEAADNGHMEAQHSIAIMYYNAQGTKRDLKAAFNYYKKAAEQGHV